MALLFALPGHAGLLDVPWKAVPAAGVEMKLTQADALRIDFDFRGRAGYAIARRDGRIELPENFELSFRIRGEAPRNSLEVKFVQGENVWWTVRREYEFPQDWRRVSIKKRQLEFAWGPAGQSPLPGTIDAIEIVVTAGTGGKGTVWIDDVAITPLEPPPTRPARITSTPWAGRGAWTADLGARYEIGGLVLEWERAPKQLELATSLDGQQWEIHAREAATWFYLPDVDARYVRLTVDDAAIRDVRVLTPQRSDNDFFMTMAGEHRRGLFPRYFLGEQSYWTILGGMNGEEEEALFSEDGAIEVGHARFSIEPFLLLEGKLVSWNDVKVEQQEGPRVVWDRHLTITPRYDNGTLHVRYQAAASAKLLLAIRPFQVNPLWQFLNRTGGVVRISEITREGDRITVEADQRATVVIPENRIAEATTLPEAHVAGPYESLLLELDGNDVTISFSLGESLGEPPTSPFVLDLPAEPRIAKTIEAQRQYILMNQDAAAIHPGSRSYERSWIRDGSLTSEALLRLGHDEVVRKFIEWYALAIREDGYVPCCVSPAGADPVPEHDSHGQFLYLVAEYYRHTGDRALVARMWPSIEKVVAFIDRLRHERMTKEYEGTAFYGMAPESISHEGYSAKAMHSYWDDFFLLKGLEDATFLAEQLAALPTLAVGPRAAARIASYRALHAEFREHLLSSIGKTMATHGIDYIPGSVELGDFDATSTTVAVTPVDADLPGAWLRATFERYWKTALEPRTYTPYELRNVGTLVRLRAAPRARATLEYYFADLRPAAWYQWAEVVRANPREGGFIGDMPHTWVGSDFVRSALDFLAYEEDGALILAAGLSAEWARQGVQVRGLSTHFGTLAYTIVPEGAALRIRIAGDDLRMPPNGILVKSPLGGTVVAHSLPADLVLPPPVGGATLRNAPSTSNPASERVP